MMNRETPKTIDVHAHYLPKWALQHLSLLDNLPAALWDLVPQRKQMERLELDCRVVSPPPFAFRYGLEPLDYYIKLNESTAEAISSHEGRFLGLAAVPLDDPDKAARELVRSRTELGLAGAAIGTVVGKSTLDDPRLEAFWTAAEQTQAVLLLHPSEIPGAEYMRRYHLRNLVGNPTGTALAAAQLIFGGVLDRHPTIKIILSHGGGALPGIIDRLDQGHLVRTECAQTCAYKPSSYLSVFFYDTIVFSDAARKRLSNIVGPSRLLFGTDAPFDMSDTAGLAHADHGTALSIFKMEG